MRNIAPTLGGIKNNGMLFQSNPIPMWIYNRNNLKFLDVNDAAIEKYGYSKNEFKNLTIRDITNGKTGPVYKKIKIDKTESWLPSARKDKKKNGKIISVNIFPKEISFNGTKGILEIINEVEDKTIFFENIKYIIESSPLAVVLINSKREIIIVNKHTEVMFGYKRNELLGKTFSILIPDDFKTIHKNHEEKFFNKPESRHINELKGLYALHKNSKLIPVEIGLNPLKYGDEIFVLANILDITKKKLAFEELEETENRFKNTIEHMTEGFQILGKDFRYLYVNKAVEKHGKKRKEELLGKKITEAYPGIDNTEMFLKLKRSMLSKIPCTMQNEFVYDDGQKSWFELNMEPVPEGILILSKDITQEKKDKEQIELYQKEMEKLVIKRTEQLEKKIKEIEIASAAIKESEENLKLIFENIYDYGIVLLDLKGNILNWSPGLEELTKYNKDELKGKHFSILFTKEDLSNKIPDKELKKVLKNGKLETEGWRIKKNGSRFWTYSAINIIKDNSGNIKGFIKVIKDMTEKMIANEKLKEHSIQLEELNNELESFSYSVSHDLRAPLRHIDGFIKLVQQDENNKLTEESKTYFKYVLDSVDKMGNLIEDLLSFSRMGRSEMNIVRVDLTKLVQEVINELSIESSIRKIKWDINPLPEISCDRAMLKQVLVNLISNSLKFTSGKNEAVIKVGSFSQNNEEVFFVKDNGAGFDMKFADKLFGVFQRLHSSKEFDGTGIGLANVKRIIERHGGCVWAEGAVNKGATIYFTLINRK